MKRKKWSKKASFLFIVTAATLVWSVIIVCLFLAVCGPEGWC